MFSVREEDEEDAEAEEEGKGGAKEGGRARGGMGRR